MDVSCPACAQRVTAALGADGNWRCPLCDIVLAHTAKKASIGKLALRRVTPGELMALETPPPVAAEPEPPVLQGEPTTGTFARPTPRFARAIVAEDVELHRQVVTDGLRERGLVGQVVATARGDHFLTAVVDHFMRLEAVDLAVLDVEMPALSGYHAALALRAVERAFALTPMPIVFFSAHPCDARFKPLLEELAPATYVNKGAGAPAELFERLEQVLRTFSGEPAV